MKSKILFLLGLLMSTFAFAQINTVQPTVMVVPFVTEGVDIRHALDTSNEKRQVIAQISGAFSDKGYPPKDFYAEYKKLSQGKAIDDESNNAKSLVNSVIQNSGADIFVEADISINRSSDGNSVRVTLKAYEASTARVLASKIGDSGKFYVNDIGKLGTKAVEKAMDGFQATMQQSFDDMSINGKSVSLEVKFDEMSTYDTRTKVGAAGLRLSQAIEEWIAENSFKNYYHVQGVTKTEMIFDEVRIPLKDARGKNYNPYNFGMDFVDFLEDLGLEVEDNFVSGIIRVSIK